MLFLKRLGTSVALFIILLVAFFMGTLCVVGAVAGARAAKTSGATDFQSGYAAGQAAGQQIGQKYGRTILMVTTGAAAISSVVISFSGFLPWCRRTPQPPPLPSGLT